MSTALLTEALDLATQAVSPQVVIIDLQTLRDLIDGHTTSLAAAALLTAIKTVDGSGSGLDADTVDGAHLSALAQLADLDGRGQGYVDFALELENNGGTLRHRFGCYAGAGTAGNFYSKIASAGTGWTNTPTGTDASTAMAGGCKITSGAAAARIAFDTADQVSAANISIGASVAYNDTTTPIIVNSTCQTRDINGVTRWRYEIEFRIHATGGVFALNTTNIGTGKKIIIQCRGRCK